MLDELQGELINLDFQLRYQTNDCILDLPHFVTDCLPQIHQVFVHVFQTLSSFSINCFNLILQYPDIILRVLDNRLNRPRRRGHTGGCKPSFHTEHQYFIPVHDTSTQILHFQFIHHTNIQQDDGASFPTPPLFKFVASQGCNDHHVYAMHEIH